VFYYEIIIERFSEVYVGHAADSFMGLWKRDGGFSMTNIRVGLKRDQDARLSIAKITGSARERSLRMLKRFADDSLVEFSAE
jgi:hypothetical protein